MADQLPAFMQRQYDYAQGFRGIGQGYAQGIQNNNLQQQMQQRQAQMQEYAQIQGMMQEGRANYQRDFAQILNDRGDPQDAAIQAYVQNAHLLDPQGFGKTLQTEEGLRLRETALDLQDQVKRLNAKNAADKIASDVLSKQRHEEMLRAIAEGRNKSNETIQSGHDATKVAVGKDANQRAREISDAQIKSKEGIFNTGMDFKYDQLDANDAIKRDTQTKDLEFKGKALDEKAREANLTDAQKRDISKAQLNQKAAELEQRKVENETRAATAKTVAEIKAGATRAMEKMPEREAILMKSKLSDLKGVEHEIGVWMSQNADLFQPGKETPREYMILSNRRNRLKLEIDKMAHPDEKPDSGPTASPVAPAPGETKEIGGYKVRKLQ